MDRLEFFYEQPWHKGQIVARKVAPPTRMERIFLTGPAKCGKSTLLKLWAKERFSWKEVLFLECDDLRCAPVDPELLGRFIKQKGIRLLCVCGYEGWPLPSCEHIWLTAKNPLKRPSKEFLQIRLKHLDFEEFLAFERKSDPKIAFNHFLKSGNFPECALLPEWRQQRRAQEIFRLEFGNELSIFKELARFQGYQSSVHFLFRRLKERFRMGKDRFYDLFERWLKEGEIHAVPKWGTKRGAKKLFFANFLTEPLLHIEREFPKIFENMVYLEIDEEAWHLEPVGFYLPRRQKALLPIPFGDEVRIQRRIDQLMARNELELRHIEVVTVAGSFSYETGGVTCEVLPFYRWALGKGY